MTETLQTSEILAEEHALLMAKGYAFLIDAERPLAEEVRPAIEGGVARSGDRLVTLLSDRPLDSVPTALEFGACRFAAAMIRNRARRQVALLDGDAYQLGRDLLRIFIREGKPLPTYAADKY